MNRRNDDPRGYEEQDSGCREHNPEHAAAIVAIRHRLNVARRTRALSAAASTIDGPTVKLFAMIEKASVSPLAALTYPAIARTLSTVPVFALTCPSAAVPESRFASDPSRPAMGSVSGKFAECLGSLRICLRMRTSASAET